MKHRVVAVGAVTLILCTPALPAQAPAAIIGRWKQNMEKSTYSPGPPPLKGSGSVRQYAAGDDGSVVAITMTLDPLGLPSLGAIAAANYNGVEYAQHTVATLASSLGSHVGPRITRTISYKPIDPYTVEITQKQDGRVVSMSRRTISLDGRTMTERFDYKNEAGQHVTNVLVFDKQ